MQYRRPGDQCGQYVNEHYMYTCGNVQIVLISHPFCSAFSTPTGGMLVSVRYQSENIYSRDFGIADTAIAHGRVETTAR